MTETTDEKWPRCSRPACQNPAMKSKRNGKPLTYCSIRCKNIIATRTFRKKPRESDELTNARRILTRLLAKKRGEKHAGYTGGEQNGWPLGQTNELEDWEKRALLHAQRIILKQGSGIKFASWICPSPEPDDWQEQLRRWNEEQLQKVLSEQPHLKRELGFEEDD